MNQLYESILQNTKTIKTKIMTELADSFILPIGGIPENVTKELDVLASIEGLVIGMLIERGILLNNEENEGFVNIFINGNTYRTHRSKLPQKGNIQPIVKEVLQNNNVEEKNDYKKEELKEPVIEDIPIMEESIIGEDTFKEDATIVFEEDSIEEVSIKNNVTYNDALSMFLEKEDENEEREFLIEECEELVIIKDDDEKNSEKIIEEYVEESIEESTIDLIDEINQTNNNITMEDSLLHSKATIIGELPQTPEVSALSREFFIEEKYKHSEQFVFDLHRISVCHMGGRAEDMEVMIAPLKIQKYSCPGVPIIVAVYYQGRMYVASSYDNNEDGKNIVPMEINEYYFLIRGFFNDKGEFQSTITTTGISASQGDLLTPVGLKKHRPTGSKVGNGHIKFKYESEYGPGVVEVFPLDIYEKDFVVMTKNEEFTDYYVVSNKGYGINRVLLYDNGVKSELVCNWDGENLEVDIVPV